MSIMSLQGVLTTMEDRLKDKLKPYYPWDDKQVIHFCFVLLSGFKLYTLLVQYNVLRFYSHVHLHVYHYNIIYDLCTIETEPFKMHLFSAKQQFSVSNRS